MVWTAPMTFTPSSVLTAAQLNTHLRDNMLETEAARAVTDTGYFVSTGANRMKERVAASARVTATEAYTATDYGDLATFGPEVTVTTGTGAFVFIAARIENDITDAGSVMSWEISGATERAAQDNTALRINGIATGGHSRQATVDMMTTVLTEGENTFTTKYRVRNGTGRFGDRFIAVLPL